LDGEAERLRDLEVDDQINLDDVLHREAGRCCRTSNGLCEQSFGTQQQDDVLRSRIQKEEGAGAI
jgi:hypothetical protein